jgi:hypothetical protein
MSDTEFNDEDHRPLPVGLKYRFQSVVIRLHAPERALPGT